MKDPKAPRTLSPHERHFLCGAGLALLAFLSYRPVMDAGYIWDDNIYLTANPCIVGNKGFWAIWTTLEAQICPLTQTTLWLIYAAFDLRPLPYHLVNVFQHAACALLLWRVLSQLKVRGAWLGAALWALHPVQVESVAWITEMRNTQSGIFFLLTISAFLRLLEESAAGEGTRRPRSTSFLVVLYAFLAMTSKSSTVILPAVLVLCVWWMGARWSWRYARLIAIVGLIAAAASVVSILGQSTGWTQSQTARLAMAIHRSPIDRILLATHAPGFYLRELFWPHPLIAVYPRSPMDPGQITSWLPALAWMLGLIFLLRQRRARPILFALLYFIVALLPVLGLVNFSFLYHANVADRLQFLASMGPLALAGAGLVSLSEIWPRLRPAVLPAISAFILGTLAFLTWRQAGYYRTSATLWEHTLAENPQCWTALDFLGVDKENKGDLTGAVANWTQALILFPNDVYAHLSLGALLNKTGRHDEALLHARRAVELLPTYGVAHQTLARVLESLGQIDASRDESRQAALLDPDLSLHSSGTPASH